MLASMDHKRALDGDEGPNTGGMGAICPNPHYTPEAAAECMEKIFLPTMRAMNAEGRTFRGCLYFGLMLTKDGPKVIEYNGRFGDPETQAVLPLLETDLLDIMEATAAGRLSELDIRWSPGASCCLILASGGYPRAYKKGLPIEGLDARGRLPGSGVEVYHAGTRFEGGKYYTNGGRVLGVTAVAGDLKSAIENIDDTNLLKQNLKRKLYSVYDNKTLADTVVRGKNAPNIRTLIEAIDRQRQAILHSYQSPHGGEVRDRRVEPFALTTNYVQVWCYDPEAGACKLFKTSRIGSVELTAEAWEHGAEHREGFIDVFRMHGGARHRVRLELGLLAYNLLCEEYPLAERDVRPLGRGRWLLDTQVAGFAGVGRFAVGLLDDIRIVDSPELTAYIRDYIAANKLL